jgi:hypothetical protein
VGVGVGVGVGFGVGVGMDETPPPPPHAESMSGNETAALNNILLRFTVLTSAFFARARSRESCSIGMMFG